MQNNTIENEISLSKLLESFLVVSEQADTIITGLSLNTQTLQLGDLFFAYPGVNSDGRKYINEAIEKGAAAVLAEASLGISETLEREGPFGQKIPVLTLENLAFHCSAIAGEYYNNPSKHMEVVGITGTNGKTSCAYYLAAAYSMLGQKTGFMGTIGCGIYGESIADTGLTTADPITVQKLLAEMHKAGACYVSMEVSSHALSQGRVAGIEFSNAVFTNLSHDHLDYHHTMLNYWQAKKRLFKDYNLDCAVVNADDPYGRELLQDLWGNQYVYGYGCAPIKESVGMMPMVSAHDIKLTRQGINARVHTPWGIGRLESPQVGRFNLSNLLAVLTTMCSMGVHLDDVLECLKNLPVVPGRMQSIHFDHKPLVIVDYAHTPDALENVLTVLKENSDGKLWCVFGCGGTRDKDKRPTMGRVAEILADNVIITDDNPRLEKSEDIIADILAGLKNPKNVVIEPDRAMAIKQAIENAAEHDIILIAGKGHETYQLIGEERMHFSDVEQAEKLLER